MSYDDRTKLERKLPDYGAGLATNLDDGSYRWNWKYDPDLAHVGHLLRDDGFEVRVRIDDKAGERYTFTCIRFLLNGEAFHDGITQRMITVTATKTPEKAAPEVKRRLIDPMQVEYEPARMRAAQQQADMTAARLLAAELASMLDGEFRFDRTNRFYYVLNRRGISVEVRRAGNVKIEMIVLADEAKAVLERIIDD